MNLLRRSWADNSSKQDFLPEHTLLKPSDASLPCHISNGEYNYDLENSHSGLNILLNKIRLTSDSLIPVHVPVPDDTQPEDSKFEPFEHLDGTPAEGKRLNKDTPLGKLALRGNNLIDEFSNTRTKRLFSEHDGDDGGGDDGQPRQLSELLDTPKKADGYENKNRKKKKTQGNGIQQIIDTPSFNGMSTHTSSKKKFRKTKAKKKSNHPLMNEPLKSFGNDTTIEMGLNHSSSLMYVPVLIPTSNTTYFNHLNPFGTMHTHFVNDAPGNTHHFIQPNGLDIAKKTHHGKGQAHAQPPPQNTSRKSQSDDSPNKAIDETISTNSKDGTLDEKQQKRLDGRLKEIAVGKSTMGYRNYIKSVPRSQRTDLDPDTPNPHAPFSASQFRAYCQSWRRTLHKYD